MYRERASGVAGAVVWTSSRLAGDGQTRVLPDGCMDLIWSSEWGLLVAGPDTVAQLAPGARVAARSVGIRLPPGAGPAVFGPPAHELRDQRVPLAALWPGPLVRRIDARVAAADRAAAGPDVGGVGGEPLAPVLDLAGSVLEAVVSARLAAAGGADPLAAAVTTRLAAGASVGATASGLGLDPRQLRRRCRPLFGYGPKTLARILRLNRALALVRAGQPAAVAAAGCGYADQPHFAREVRTLTGVSLGDLRSR